MDDRSEQEAEAARRIDAAQHGSGSSLSLAGLGLTAVPLAVAGLIGLTELDLSDNQLSALPDWIGGLTSLESLLLRGNKLVGLPDSVTALRKLTHLDVSMNRLIDIPLGLAVLDELTYLGLTGNRRLIYPPPHIVARSGEAAAAYTRGLAPDAARLNHTAAGRTPGPAADAPTRPLSSLSAPAPDSASPHSRSPQNDAGTMTTRTRVLIALACAALLGVAATALALGSSHGSSPGAQSANAYGTTDPGASTAATGPTGAGSPKTSATSGQAGTDARSPGTSADQTRSASPDVSGQAATGQSAEPPTPRSDPLPPTAGTPAVPVAPPDQDLALGRPATASSFTQNYVAQNAVDGNTGTYWESQNGSTVFPQSLTVNLGSVTTVGRLVLNLPPVAAWNSRTETLSVLGAGASGGFSTIAGSASYGFNAGSGGNDDTVTVAFGAVHVQYVELVFTANTGWPAAQLSELGVYS